MYFNNYMLIHQIAEISWIHLPKIPPNIRWLPQSNKDVMSPLPVWQICEQFDNLQCFFRFWLLSRNTTFLLLLLLSCIRLQYNTCMHFECCNHSREQRWKQYKYYFKYTGEWLIFTNPSNDAGSMNIGIKLRTLKAQTFNTMSYLIALFPIIFLVKKCKWLEQARIANKKLAQ